MAIVDHVTIRVSDYEPAVAFYGRVFELLAFPGERYDDQGFVEWNDFSICPADAEHPPTRNLHVGFGVATTGQVDRFWQVLTEAGYRDDGPPGPRPEYSPGYYGAFLRDADDNSIEAVTHDSIDRDHGLIDHLWIRVRDLDASRHFYTALAPVVGVEARERGDRVHFRGGTAKLTILAGDPPTENVHLAFGVPDRETVAAFHAAGLAAGARDNGGPGERPQYHPGYYGAYLLDPDGNNVEAVFHDR